MSIVKQVKDKEFEKEILVREAQYKNDKEQSLKLTEAKLEKEFNEELNKKELEISELKSNLKSVETETKNKIEKEYTDKINKQELEINNLKNKIEVIESKKELDLKIAVDDKEKEITLLNNNFFLPISISKSS